jgi:PPOX class probable F420-dependent enzyme
VRALTETESGLLDEARTAVLATIDPAGRPRLVPICFVVGGDAVSPTIYSPIDDKPKASADPRRLARVRDITAKPEVSLLVQHWDEDWTRLAWLRMHGTAELVEPDGPVRSSERAEAIAALRSKYRQYADHDLEGRPLIRIAVTELTSWPGGAAVEPD